MKRFVCVVFIVLLLLIYVVNIDSQSLDFLSSYSYGIIGEKANNDSGFKVGQYCFTKFESGQALKELFVSEILILYFQNDKLSIEDFINSGIANVSDCYDVLGSKVFDGVFKIGFNKTLDFQFVKKDNISILGIPSVYVGF